MSGCDTQQADLFSYLSPETRIPGEEPDEVGSARERRTCVLGDQANLWVGKSSLSGACQEYQLALRGLRFDESVRGAPAPVGGGLADVWVNEVVGSPTVGQSRPRRFRISAVPYGYPFVDYPRN